METFQKLKQSARRSLERLSSKKVIYKSMIAVALLKATLLSIVQCVCLSSKPLFW